MISFRTKMWFVLVGIDFMLCLLGITVRNPGYALFAGGMTLFSWYIAHNLLDMDAEELMKKLEGRD